MRIAALELRTDRLDEMKDFYSNVLGFKLMALQDEAFEIQAGSTLLAFKRESGNVQPFYHFAFNISENLLPESVRWLVERGVELLSTQDGEIEVDQGPKWNAHSCYFHDPAGNIVEFIARHDLNSGGGAFTVDDVVCVSEIGPVTNVEPVVKELRVTCGLEVWRNENDPKFVAMGDDEGMMIVVDHKRPWFPSNELPVVSPVKAVIQTGTEGVWEWKSRLCEIQSM